MKVIVNDSKVLFNDEDLQILEGMLDAFVEVLDPSIKGKNVRIELFRQGENSYKYYLFNRVEFEQEYEGTLTRNPEDTSKDDQRISAGFKLLEERFDAFVDDMSCAYWGKFGWHKLRVKVFKELR